MKKIIVFIIGVLLLVSTGFTQTDTLKTKVKVPSLYGHNFPSMGQFRSSFVNTHFLAHLGVGSTSPLTIPGVTVGDYQLSDFTGQLFFFNSNVRYQQRFTPWLALTISVKLAGRLGTDMSTILVDGVNTINGGRIGWLVRIKQTERFNLSGSLNLSNLTGNFINVSEYIEEIINNNPSPSVFKKIPSMTVGVGILGAYAFNPTYGIQFHTEYSYGESFQRETNSGIFSIGIMGDVDLAPKHNAPVGFALAYTLTTAPEIVMAEGGISNIFSGKIGYTGSEDFEIGLKYSFYNIKIESVDDNTFVNQIAFVLKFYF